jgi:signal transduction histidine kinase
LRVRDARIRSKLALILVVPVLAIVSLAVLRLADSGQRAITAEQISALTALSADVAGATQGLQAERMAAAEYVSVASASPVAFSKQTKAADVAIAAYKDRRGRLGTPPVVVAGAISLIDSQLETLEPLRQQVQSRAAASANEVVVRYTVVIDDLVAYHGLVSELTTDPGIATALRALAAFDQAKAQVAQEQAVGYASLKSGQLDNEQYNSFVTTLTAQQSALSAFDLAANPAQRAVVNSTITGDAVQLADQVALDVGRSIGLTTPRVSADELYSSLNAVVDLMRFAEQRLESQVLALAKAEEVSVIREVVIESALVILTLALAVTLAFLLARAMARSLSALREGALAVAGRDLPEAVARLRDVRDIGENSPDEIARQVRDPIEVTSRDEIGQVAEAFNVVHREAVRVAAEQAALRTSVSAMFLNLARRSQALVDRMIGELDTIERTEEDPKRLAQLFQLDHLATRMRRNDENLLVLAGADSSAPRREDAQLADVVRAAQAEVELYNRIEFGTIDQDVSIAAHAVNDVVRLIAELFDNATRFSPPNSSVLADGRRIGDYVLIQVEDRGLGMAREQMAALNHRLAEPPSVDVAAFRMMGLAVVARLADRYQIKVELRSNPEGGTITNVTLPTNILVLPRLRGREPVVTRPRSPLAVERGPVAPAVGPSVPVGPPGWPMPQLPGLAAANSPALAGSGVGTATLSGWADLVDTRTGYGSPQPMTVSPAAIDALGTGTGTQSRVAVDDTAELPIFRAMDAQWFRSHGHSATESWPTVGGARAGSTTTSPPQPQSYAGTPSTAAPSTAAPSVSAAGATAPSMSAPSMSAPSMSAPSTPVTPAYQPPMAASTTGYVPAGATAPPAPPPTAVPPPPRAKAGDEPWRTSADDGWRAAAAAAEPTTAGTTRSGLPKRVPAAQLVPGGVDNRAAKAKARRTPDEVRGLLSAYHRGVQRGRAGGDGISTPAARPTDEETH